MSYQSVGVTGVTTFNKIPEYARGILEHSSNFQNCIKSTNKIPPYAREYKKEYLFIIGINKEFKYFVDHINDATKGLFERQKVDRVKYLIKRFLRGQERGKLKDISNFMFPRYDFLYIQEFYININYAFEFEDNPSYVAFFDLIEKSYNKIKIEFVFSDYYGEGQYV